MKMNLYKKIIALTLILSFILPSVFIPNRANALGAEVVTDPGNTGGTFANLAENAVSAVSNAASYVSDYLIQIKEYVLDTLVHTLIQQIIRQLGQSVIDWINTGFEGSPAFVQDPGAFFLDLADQMTGEFIDGAGGPLKSLCSPFSIDLKIALAFKYHPKGAGKRYECTLSTIIKNSENAIKNASINGFTAGDFKQGGWPSFVSMTTEPQNNIYGAYLEADSELSFKVGGIQSEKKAQLMQGSGFLSYADPACVKKANSLAKAVNDGGDLNVGTNEDTNLVKFNEKDGSFSANKASCPTVTPGSQIANTLKTNVDAGSDASVAADEIGEIIDALIAQLATQILQVGLAAISQKDSSGNSYYNNAATRLQDEKDLADLKTSSMSEMPTFIETATQYKTNVDSSLAIANDVTNIYESTQTCYQEKLNEVPTQLLANEITIANTRIQEIVAILAGDLFATTTRLTTMSENAQQNLDTLNEIQVSTDAAPTTLDLQAVLQTFTNLVRGGTLPTAIDVKNSNQDLTNIQKTFVSGTSAPSKTDASNRLTECEGFPENTRTGDGY